MALVCTISNPGQHGSNPVQPPFPLSQNNTRLRPFCAHLCPSVPINTQIFIDDDFFFLFRILFYRPIFIDSSPSINWSSWQDPKRVSSFFWLFFRMAYYCFV